MVGLLSTGSFDFATGQFWFIAGALLLVMLSLVDQPHFSKHANVFVNGTTALISLFVISESQRTGIWWVFFFWAIYLIASSFTLMALMSRGLFLETKITRFVSRVNRAIGRPESVFSAFFLWGVFIQFSYPKDGLAINSLFIFWAVFMILNVPGIAQAVSELFTKPGDTAISAGVIAGIQSPHLAVVNLRAGLSEEMVGKKVVLTIEDGKKVAEGTLFEDHIVKGLRQGRIALTDFSPNWSGVSAGGRIEIAFSELPVFATRPIGVVSSGSSIGKLSFEVDPRTELHAGEVVKVKMGSRDSYYQIVAATIDQTVMDDGNSSQSVRVTAGQLGHWDENEAAFVSIDWVAPAGELIAVSRDEGNTHQVPKGHCVVGHVPNSMFPVHIDLAETVTHNTAIVGVTGSGKSYLAFHIIDELVKLGIKVLILDISRQHDLHMAHHKPTGLKTVADVPTWLASNSCIGIHQYGVDSSGYPQVTSTFVAAAYAELSKTKLERGKNIPAKLCIVFEEAHSLIPEWNQVAQEADRQHVNKTARTILQGRKYGMGALIITQRTANVTKTILNQCNTILALRSFDQTGLDFLKNYMGDEYSQAISTLPRYSAVLVGQASSSSRPLILKISDFSSRALGQAPTEAASPVTPVPQ
jgi:hypothetical protein